MPGAAAALVPPAALLLAGAVGRALAGRPPHGSHHPCGALVYPTVS